MPICDGFKTYNKTFDAPVVQVIHADDADSRQKCKAWLYLSRVEAAPDQRRRGVYFSDAKDADRNPPNGFPESVFKAPATIRALNSAPARLV